MKWKLQNLQVSKSLTFLQRDWCDRQDTFSFVSTDGDFSAFVIISTRATTAGTLIKETPVYEWPCLIAPDCCLAAQAKKQGFLWKAGGYLHHSDSMGWPAVRMELSCESVRYQEDMRPTSCKVCWVAPRKKMQLLAVRPYSLKTCFMCLVCGAACAVCARWPVECEAQ